MATAAASTIDPAGIAEKGKIASIIKSIEETAVTGRTFVISLDKLSEGAKSELNRQCGGGLVFTTTARGGLIVIEW
jgi:hypothetical protein